jgi:kynureninase
MTPMFEESEGFAQRLDERDPLRRFRERFEIPAGGDGEPVIYFNGNSLGLMPKTVRAAMQQELDDWSQLAVDAHFRAKTPWYSYHEVFRESGARLVGAMPGEVVMMNGLTVNLHLMMETFYRPEGTRRKILIEDGAFPSDAYAVESRVRARGLDSDAIVRVFPREGESLLRTEDILAAIEREGDALALVLLPGVQYYTGQLLDIPTITEATHAAGATAGWDLAHAAGNVPLALHDWDVDFAVWCSYKYLNAGPGAIAGCFVHERHGANLTLPRLAGWWGNDPEMRFKMNEARTFQARAGADGWQVSNPPILAMAPLKESLAIFDEAGMDSLRRKSIVLTAYLEWLLERAPNPRFDVITPRDAEQRGCQLSLRAKAGSLEVLEGIVVDRRPPDVIRIAPVPLYNTFHEVWRAAKLIQT